ncbi:MAG: tetratricopeptide repeat protein [bacterium]|jgi:tetratricopeptide (TPR) repeat protein|nr:MAG: hypothetical protein DIU52_09555 [bacterium]
MEPTRANLRRLVASAVGIVAATALFAAPEAVHAQSRYRVLVPALKAEGGAKENFGRDVAERLRKSLEGMATHAPVDRGEMRAKLREVKRDEKELVDCVTARQFAVYINAMLYLCGEYRPAGSGMEVKAQFVTARTGEAFEIPPFTANTADEAAQIIFNGFETVVNQQRLTTFCLDYLASEQWTNALENCNNALALNPNSEAALFGRARALLGLDSLEVAMQELEKLLELNPGHVDGLQTAGYVATKLNQPQKALEYYRAYLDLNPGDPQVRLTIAIDMARNGDPKGALELVEEGLAVDSSNLNLRQYAGHFALAAATKIETDSGARDPQRPAEALALYEKALGYYQSVFDERGSESDVEMLRRMMVTLVALDRTAEAVEMGARFVQAKPEDASLWSSYADALQKAGRLEEAIAALDSVLARDPNYERVYSRQVAWLASTGQIARIKAAYEKALARQEYEAQPDELARSVLLYAYNEKFQKGDQMGALPYFELVREMNTTPQTRGLASYLGGFALLNHGRKVSEPETLQSAREALPIFQKARQFFLDARPYAEANKVDLAEPLSNVDTFIEIQEAIIKRGR